jgi:hypothetical protein
MAEAEGANAPTLELEALLPAFSALLCDLVKRGERDARAVVTRNELARLLSVAPLLCRAVRDEARNDPTLAPLLLYERTRMCPLAPNDHFLRHCPASVVLFGIPSSVALPEADIAELTFADVLADRNLTVRKLEGVEATRTAFAQLERTHATPDLPAALPAVVRIFVSRVRAVHTGLRATHRTHEFGQCHHARCNRFFFCGVHTTADLQHGLAYGTSADGAHVCAVGGAFVYGPDRRRFCSPECARQWWARAAEAVGHACVADARIDHAQGACVLASLAAPLPGTRHTRDGERGRPALEYAAALKRNGEVAARMRAAAKRKRKRDSVDAVAFKALRTSAVEALNVDTCLLYAASLLCRSGVLVRNTEHALPGETMHWRVSVRGKTPHVGAARALRRIVTDAIVLDEARDPVGFLLTSAHDTRAQRLLGTVKRRVLELF